MQGSSWSQLLNKVSIPSISLPVPKEFVDFLLEDGVFLPEDYQDQWSLQKSESDDDSFSVPLDPVSDVDDKKDPRILFPDLCAKVEQMIVSLGGSVFPKISGSAPVDAHWVATNRSLRCSNFLQIVLLLKSSDICTYELKRASNLSHSLVLKQWFDIPDSAEFRCFVKQKRLLAVCQRNIRAYFPHLDKNSQELTDRITAFYQKYVCKVLPLDDFVLDLYVSANRVWVIDVGMFGAPTESLLFSWSELETLATQDHLCQFRCLLDEGEAEVRLKPAMPVDFHNILYNHDSGKLAELLRAQIELQNGESSDEDVAMTS